ncbi:hypothetical protein NBRC116588_28130 [Pyruvatibacter sp. HU-CL02332]
MVGQGDFTRDQMSGAFLVGEDQQNIRPAPGWRIKCYSWSSCVSGPRDTICPVGSRNRTGTYKRSSA